MIGEGYSRPVIEGTTSEVLDTFGLGHYPGTARPGDEGNFAVAGHRQTNGAVLDHIDALTEGERIIVHAQLESWRPNSAGPP
ncbi:sortase domain-containing protein, partial [Kocuria palustris]|uniref:sortase domain-containing protein n=1 Tax=Kocuria palustris TaxID=71999 RepID=UPI003D72A284